MVWKMLLGCILFIVGYANENIFNAKICYKGKKHAGSEVRNEFTFKPHKRLVLRGGKAALSVLTNVRSSIESVPLANDLCWINETALQEFSASLDAVSVNRIARYRFQLPLKFDDLAQEINFYGILHAIGFGSGWHEMCDREYGEKARPHRDSALHGIIQLFMEGGKVGYTDYLTGLKLFDLSQAFSIPITKEKRIDGGPIRQDVPSDYRQLIDAFYNTLTQIGSELQARGFKSFADFIFSVDLHGYGAADVRSAADSYTADRLVARLSECFECFRDEATVPPPPPPPPLTGADAGATPVPATVPAPAPVGKGKPVLFHRKAQRLANELWRRFGSMDVRVNFTDTAALLGGADADTVAQLRRHGVVVLAPALANRVDGGRNLRVGSREEVTLRAVGVRACLAITDLVNARRDPAAPVVTVMDVVAFLDFEVRSRHDRILRRLEEAAAAAAPASRASFDDGAPASPEEENAADVLEEGAGDGGRGGNVVDDVVLEGKGSKEEPRIYELPPTLDKEVPEDVAEPVRAHRCRDSLHY